METLEALRTLTSLALPSRRTTSHLAGAPASASLGRLSFPWEKLWEPAMENGVAPLVAYNMEYRLGGGGAPQDVHDALLGYYQGTLNDNVYKLVTLKRMLDAAEFPVTMLHAAAYADAIYPHIAFRPLPELRLLVDRKNFFRFAEIAKEERFVPQGEQGGAMVLSDNRFNILLHESIWPHGKKDDLHSRGIRAKAFGHEVWRPSIEDALLTHVSLLAANAFEAPLIEYVDLRELVQGGPSQSGTYGRAPDARTVLDRAHEVGLSRALYCAMALLVHFFPEVEGAARPLTPEINVAVRALLDKAVVEPSKPIDRKSVNRVAEEIRKLLAGS